MTMGVLEAQLVQLVVSERRYELTRRGVHRVQKVGGALQRIDAAAAVVRRIVVELNPARGQPVVVVDLVIGFADLELRRLHVRRRVRLWFESELRDDRGSDGNEARRRQVTTRLLPAAIEEDLVLDEGATECGRPGVDARFGFDGVGRNRRAVGRRRRAAAPKKEGKRAETPPPE